MSEGSAEKTDYHMEVAEGGIMPESIRRVHWQSLSVMGVVKDAYGHALSLESDVRLLIKETDGQGPSREDWYKFSPQLSLGRSAKVRGFHKSDDGTYQVRLCTEDGGYMWIDSDAVANWKYL